MKIEDAKNFLEILQKIYPNQDVKIQLPVKHYLDAYNMSDAIRENGFFTYLEEPLNLTVGDYIGK